VRRPSASSGKEPRATASRAEQPSKTSQPSQSSWGQQTWSRAQHSTARRTETSRAAERRAESGQSVNSGGMHHEQHRTQPRRARAAGKAKRARAASRASSRAPISGSEQAGRRSRHEQWHWHCLCMCVEQRALRVRVRLRVLLADRCRSSMISLCWKWRGVENTGVGKREEGARGGRDQRLIEPPASRAGGRTLMDDWIGAGRLRLLFGSCS
jgi:hypothetical protein